MARRAASHGVAAGLYTNHRFLAGPAAPPTLLPQSPWAFAEQRLLERSEQRLQSIEGKGPGLATVCAVIAAAIGVAISLTWGDARTLARVLLGISAAYAAMSLAAPIKLVGPIERSTIIPPSSPTSRTVRCRRQISHVNAPRQRRTTIAARCA